MHQQDLDRCVAHGTCPNIAELAEHGVIYTKAFTPGLSDSVPGLAALVTGGSPLSTGLFYDDVYDRTLYPGTDPTCSTTPGVEVFLQEQVGVDNLNGGALLHLDGGGASTRNRFRAARLALIAFPYTPTILSRQTRSLKSSSRILGDHTRLGPTSMPGGPTGSTDRRVWAWMTLLAPRSIPSIRHRQPGGDYTQSFSGNTATDPAYLHTETFDNIHLKNVLSQINGMDSTGTNLAPVPTIFGTNFQTLECRSEGPQR